MYENSIVNCLNHHCKTQLISIGPPREVLQRRNKTALGPRGQNETSLKIEDLRSNKTTGKLS